MFISFMLGDMDMDNYLIDRFVKYFYNVENMIIKITTK